MPRKPKPQQQSDLQLEINFDEVIHSAKVHSRPQEGTYDPLETTAEYMQRAVEIEQSWGTTFQKVREVLLQRKSRQLYFDFLMDLRHKIAQNSSKSEALAKLLTVVANRGLGMSKQQIHVTPPAPGRTRWKVHFDEGAVQKHLDDHILGEYFLNPVTIDETVWDGRLPIIGASDVSQHRSAVPVPAHFFRRSVPFVLNNAAGSTFHLLQNGHSKFENIFNPKPDEKLMRWMLIDPSYQDDLENEDYQRCLDSAMDVGQYKFDLEYLLKAHMRPPDIIFRDGSLFPQDAYLDNFVMENRRGDFTREAIREMLDCLSYAREIGVVYCGVSKNVQLKVYSAIVDWFIANYIDPNWQFGNYTFNDGQMMSVLLASPSFVGNNLEQTVATCLIRRSFTTRANLNLRADLNNLDAHFQTCQNQHPEVDINPYKRLCEIAHVYMFFIGHSKSPQEQLPRYEFFYSESLGSQKKIAQKILSGIQSCGIAVDNDHSFMAERPVSYLIPTVTHHAHTLSKDVGNAIDSTTGQWIMSRFQKMVKGN